MVDDGGAEVNSIRHGNTTATLAAPDGWDEHEDGECLGLPIVEAHGCMFSYWRPSLAERLKIALGGHIRLAVFGRQHPPVSIDTLN